ncbi:phage holin family protein [Fructilactobacillus sp. Tb1]|uniref:phage holin family protein n=1 Tax=Fructilactobacillus sp. Tb1 TaxID=3422304 RepID=UPI003D287CC0
MKFFSRILINFILFMAFSGLFPAQFFLGNWTVALAASLVLTILEIFIKPILSLLFLPINLLTFGLFNLVINAVILELTSWFMGSDFHFSSFSAVFIISLLMSLCNYIITSYFRD